MSLDIDNLLGMYGEEEPNGSPNQDHDDEVSEGTAQEEEEEGAEEEEEEAYDVGEEDGVYDDERPEEDSPPEDEEGSNEDDDQDDQQESGDDEENSQRSGRDQDEEDDEGSGDDSHHSEPEEEHDEDDDDDDDESEATSQKHDDDDDTRSVVSSSRKSTSRTDALFEHANWKERKLEEKRQQEASKLTFAPKTNTSTYRNRSSSMSSVSRLSAHERLYQHGQRKRDASLTAKRREIDEREMFGAFSKSTYSKPGHDKLASRVPPRLAWAKGEGGGGGDRTWGDAMGDPNDAGDDAQSVRSSSSSVLTGRPKLWDRSRPRSASGNNVTGPSSSRSAHRSTSSARSSTRRTDALYLESILRQQRREAKLRDLEDQHSFQPDLSRGRSLYREPYEKMESSGGGGRGSSVHDRLYDAGSRKREFTQDVVAKVYSRSRIARNRRMVEYAMNGGAEGVDPLDHNGDPLEGDDLLDFDDTRSVGSRSRRSASTTHTQRTDALYLEATLRRARKEEKAAQRDPEHTFSPATNSNGSLPRYNSKPGQGRQRSASVNNVGQYRSLSEASGVSRHDLLYMDGERKRQRNIDARFDPHQKGTGELMGMYNTKWHSSARQKQFNPLLLTKQEDNLNRRFSMGGGGDHRHHETRSLDGFSVGTDLTGASARSHTRRTEALYLEASLRAARKEAMREAYADHGFSFQPQVKTHGSWAGQTKSLNNVVSRLYNPQAAAEEKQEKEAKKKAYELKDFVGTPQIKVVQGRSRALESNAFERLHTNAQAKAQAIHDKASSLLAAEKKIATFAPMLAAKGTEKVRSRSASRTRHDDWVPKTGASTTVGTSPSFASSSSSSSFRSSRSSSFSPTSAGAPASSASHKPNSPHTSSSSSSSRRASVSAFDPKTGRPLTTAGAADRSPSPPPPMSALERFRLRQAGRAKKREEEEKAAAAAAAAAVEVEKKYRYPSPTRSPGRSSPPSSPVSPGGSRNPLLASEVESY